MLDTLLARSELAAEAVITAVATPTLIANWPVLDFIMPTGQVELELMVPAVTNYTAGKCVFFDVRKASDLSVVLGPVTAACGIAAFAYQTQGNRILSNVDYPAGTAVQLVVYGWAQNGSVGSPAAKTFGQPKLPCYLAAKLVKS